MAGYGYVLVGGMVFGIIITSVIIWAIATKTNWLTGSAMCIEKFSDNNIVYWFHRPGCPHCDNMKGEWGKMKRSLSSKYKIIDVDTTLPQNTQLANRYRVNGVPHIVKVSSSGGQSVYNGNRTADAMKQWVING